MRVVETPWDSLILGRPAATVIVGRGDGLCSLDQMLEELAETFVTIKSDFWSFEMADYLLKKGFFQVESLFSLQFDMKHWRGNLGDMLDVSVATMDDIESVKSEIALGRFSTDRFSLNPDVKREMASRRYVNWLEEEVKEGAELYIVRAKSKVIGFFCYRDRNCEPFIALSGTFSNSPPSSGTLLHYGIFKLYEWKENKNVGSVVSSNNPAALRLHSRLGYEIVECHWIFQSRLSSP